MSIIDTLQEEVGPFMEQDYADRMYLFDLNAHILIHSNGVLETWGEDYRILKYKTDHWDEIEYQDMER